MRGGRNKGCGGPSGARPLKAIGLTIDRIISGFEELPEAKIAVQQAVLEQQFPLQEDLADFFSGVAFTTYVS